MADVRPGGPHGRGNGQVCATGEGPMLSKIPSWSVGVAGAAIAIVATVANSTLLYQTRTDIADVRSELADTRGRVERLWSSHR